MVKLEIQKRYSEFSHVDTKKIQWIFSFAGTYFEGTFQDIWELPIAIKTEILSIVFATTEKLPVSSSIWNHFPKSSQWCTFYNYIYRNTVKLIWAVMYLQFDMTVYLRELSWLCMTAQKKFHCNCQSHLPVLKSTTLYSHTKYYEKHTNRRLNCWRNVRIKFYTYTCVSMEDKKELQ